MSLKFKDIPEEYQLMIHQIEDGTLQGFYSYFNFYILTIENNQISNDYDEEEENIDQETLTEDFLFNYLKYFNFITYQISNNFKKLFLPENKSDEKDIYTNNDEISDLIICFEKECFIIENMSISSIKSLLNELNEQQISIINTTKLNEKEEEDKANREITNFCLFSTISKEIKFNKFVKYSIRPIAGYLIRRYFYPSNHFKDKSFFRFNKSDNWHTIDFIKKKISNLLFIDSNENKNFNEIINLIQSNRNIPTCHIEFKENEFIKLRYILINDQAVHYLVIHRKSLYVFMMKKFNSSRVPIKDNKREIEFCKQYQSQFLTRFYGFMKENEKITGLIYEYMSNGSLKEYLKSNHEQRNHFFSLMIISRIFQGIDYLHSNLLIHRDIKPSNILLDHDFIPYISDFPTIRHPISKEENNDYSNDFGSDNYMSPEHYQGDFISYPCDIYSFGLVIYFVFVNKDIILNYNYYELEHDIPTIEGASNNIQSLFQSCIKYQPSERIKNDEIKRKIITEINSISFTENDVFTNINEEQFIQFIYDVILIEPNNLNIQTLLKINNLNIQTLLKINNVKLLPKFYANSGPRFTLTELIENHENYINVTNNREEWKDYFDVINILLYKFTLSEVSNDSNAQCFLGRFFWEGKGYPADILKALYYLLLASNQNHPIAQCCLGMIYFSDDYISHDYNKAVHYFTLAANQNNVISQYFLGMMYTSSKYNLKDTNKAIHYFTLAANQNNLNSQIYLGDFYYNQKDINKSLYYYKLAANQNDPEAQYNLGYIYYEDKYVSRDINKAIHYLTLASDQDNCIAQKVLGDIYISGKSIPRDIDKSIHYYTLASSQGNVVAQYSLGFIYYNSGDIKKALHYFLLAANQNHNESLFVLGMSYYYGKYVPQDIDKGLHYLSLAANGNFSLAQYNLGYIYHKGEHVRTDINKAIFYYKLAANQNHANAQNELGLIYLNIQFDINKAIHYLSLAANRNISSAQYDLGLIYYKDKYVSRDINKAIHYFTLAAKQNDISSQFCLGTIYYENKYVSRDINKAIHYFTLTAYQNEINSQYILGKIYYNGTYIARDVNKAIYFLTLAANQNDSESLNMLGNIYYGGEYIPQDINKAIHYYTLAANQNNSNALNMLGNIYSEGKYIPQDINKAIHYLTLAANLNNYHAQLLLGTLYYNGDHVPCDKNKGIHYITLAANQNKSYPNCFLGIAYLFDESVQDINKGIKYIQYSAYLNCREAQKYLGDFYFEGKYMKRDIRESIRLYKEASCFNDKYAKNNLGVIYSSGIDGIPKNTCLAKEYFNEAIRQSGDIISMFNLSNILLDEEENEINERKIPKNKEYFKLLIESSIKDFNPSMTLLCFLLIQKYAPISMENVFNELKHHYNVSLEFVTDIYQYCERLLLRYDENEEEFLEDFYNVRNTYLLYILNDIKSLQTIDENLQQMAKEESKLANINDFFYEGFGYDLYN